MNHVETVQLPLEHIVLCLVDFVTEITQKSQFISNRALRLSLSLSLSNSSSALPEDLPLALLQKGGLVHDIMKRDISNQSQVLDLWNAMLSMYLPYVFLADSCHPSQKKSLI